MNETKNKRVTIIDNKDSNGVLTKSADDTHGKSSMDILADIATALVDKEMESLLPPRLNKLVGDTKLATASEHYEKAVKALKRKTEGTPSYLLSMAASTGTLLDRKSIALSSVVFTAGRPFDPEGLLLSQMAECAGVPLEVLLSPLSEYVELLGVSYEYGEIIKLTIKRFVISSLLHEKYVRIMSRAVDETAAMDPSKSPENETYRMFMTRLGWLLFVLLKGSASLKEDELQSKLYHLLLCCVNFVCMNSPLGMFSFFGKNPPSKKNVPVGKDEKVNGRGKKEESEKSEKENEKDSQGMEAEEEGGGDAGSVEFVEVKKEVMDDDEDVVGEKEVKKPYYSLEALCVQNGMPYYETLDLQVSVFHNFISKLRQDGLITIKSLDNTRSEAQREFISLDNLRRALSNLDALYDEKLSYSWEFDERLFQRDLSILTSSPQPTRYNTNNNLHQPPQAHPTAAATTTTPSGTIATTPMKSITSKYAAYARDFRARFAPMPTPAAKAVSASASKQRRASSSSSSFAVVGTPARPPPPTPLRSTVGMLSWLDGLMNVPPGPGPVLARLLRENGLEEQAAELNTKLEELAATLGLGDVHHNNNNNHTQQQNQQHQTTPVPASISLKSPLSETILSNNGNNPNNNQSNPNNPNNSIVPYFVAHKDPSKRVALCLRVFYRLLDSLVAREIATKKRKSLLQAAAAASKSRIPGSSASGSSISSDAAKELLEVVLTTGPLVRSVLATAAEIVAYAARNTPLTFPSVVRALKLQPFEFFRILNNIFNLSEPFPSEALLHLRVIETALVDSLVWEPTSSILPLYAEVPPSEIIAIAESLTPTLPLRDAAVSLAATHSVPSTPEKSPHSAAVCAQPPPPKTVAATTASSSDDGGGSAEQRKDAVMHRGFAILLRRFFTISAKKFEVLCAKDSSQALLNQMWYVFVHAIAEHKELLPEHTGTHLVLCAYAGVMRANSRTADIQHAAALLHTPPNFCNGVLLSTYSAQQQQQSSSSERKVGTLQEYYNSTYVGPVSKYIFKARTLFKDISALIPPIPLPAPLDGAAETGQQQQQQQQQMPPPPTLLAPGCRGPLESARKMRALSMVSPRRLFQQSATTPSAAARSSSSSSSSLAMATTLFPQSPSRVLPLYTEVKARPGKRALSEACFPQRTLNFDEVGGNEYADDEKSESDLEKDKPSEKRPRHITEELSC